MNQDLPILYGKGVDGRAFPDCLTPSLPSPPVCRIVCMSDTHDEYSQLVMRNKAGDTFTTVPHGDLLLHAGDAATSPQRAMEDLRRLNYFLESLEIPEQIFVPGNHDLPFDLASKREKALRAVSHPHVALGWKHPSALKVVNTPIGPLKVYGEPRQPWFYSWAFNWPRDRMRELWDEVPSDVDILVTHGPPLGAGDLTTNGKNVGCEFLREWIERVQPRLVVCGHIHNGYGIYMIGKTIVVNASICNERYQGINPPIVINLTKPLIHTEI